MVLHEIIEQTKENHCVSAILEDIFKTQWTINDFT